MTRRAPSAAQRGHLAAQAQHAAAGGDVAGQSSRDLREVDRLGLGDVQRAQSRGVRLDLAELLRAQLAQADEPVGPAAPVQLGQRRQLRRASGDHQLARPHVRDALLVGEGQQRAPPGAAQRRLQRARRVVQPGVDHPGVAPALVQGELALALVDDDAGAGLAQQQGPGYGETDDPRADHRVVVLSQRASCRG